MEKIMSKSDDTWKLRIEDVEASTIWAAPQPLPYDDQL